MSEVYDTDEEAEPVVLQHEMSMPSLFTDPFAPREGKTLVWKDVNMTLVRNVGSTEDFHIFDSFAEILTLGNRINSPFDTGWSRRCTRAQAPRRCVGRSSSAQHYSHHGTIGCGVR
jgi:hypothetical protein